MVLDKLNLTGRRALVTGGKGHIGRAIVAALAELGATVAILDRPSDHKIPEAALDVSCNLLSEKGTRLAVRKAIREMGGLEILIHCAAFIAANKHAGWAVPFEKQTVKAWNAAMQVNLTSALVLVQESKKALAAGGNGSVIFFSSIYGVVGPDMRLYEGTDMINPAAYNASKGGLLQMTRYFSTMLAPAVRVNAISPGGVYRRQPEAFHKRYKARCPMGRMATEDDLTGAAVFLASDLSSYITGQNILVDGGWTAW